MLSALNLYRCLKRFCLTLLTSSALGISPIAVFAQDSSPTAQENASASEPKEAATDSATAKPKPTRPDLPRHLMTREHDVLQQTKPSQQVWLKDGSSGDKGSLAIWQPVIAGDPKGAILMMIGGGQDPLWPNTVSTLSQYLAMHGWASLIVNTPNLPGQTIPKRPTPPPADDNAETGDTTAVDETQVVFDESSEQAKADTPDDDMAAPENNYQSMKKQALARLDKGLTHLNQNGQFNIALLGEGISADWIIAFGQALSTGGSAGSVIRSGNASATISKAIRATILLNAHQSDFFAGVMALPDEQVRFTFPLVPTLDLYIKNYQNASEAAKVRQQMARSLAMTSYRQKAVLEATQFDAQTAINKRIRGFLDKHAAGVKMQ